MLIIDDDADGSFLMGEILRLRGYDAETEATAYQGLDRYERSPFDVVICDLNLPDTSGTVVAQRLSARTPQPLLIAVTGFARDDVRATCMAAGFTHVLGKPLEWDELVNILQRLTPAG